MAQTTNKNIDLGNYLRTHSAVKGENHTYTHTRIGDKDKIYGGCYSISDAEWKSFMQMYHHHVFTNGNLEYLTEKHLIEDGPILVDIDFRYPITITTKQHSEDHIIDAVMLYADKISQLVDVSHGANIEVFVMEKPDVNVLVKESKTKDGIHIIFGLKMHKACQVLLRDKILTELQPIWDDLPITNSWDEILDEGVTKGQSNWQLYGSRKPDNQAYEVKYHYNLSYSKTSHDGAGADADSGDWSIEKNTFDKFQTDQYIYKLSARYKDYPGFPLKAGIYEEFEAAKLTLSKNNTIKVTNAKAGGGPPTKYKINIKNKNIVKPIYSEIKDEATLDNMIEVLFENIGTNTYRLKETHQYVMSLPAAYYGPGSYNKWIRVGMALHNTHIDLFLSWLKLSCQDNCRDSLKGVNGKFDWKLVPVLYDMWIKLTNDNTNMLTYRSIMYWSKNDARDKYDLIRKETVDFFISQTLQTTKATDFDLASVLYAMFKDNYVCHSIKNKDWFEYKNHRWHKNDQGSSLRLAISKDMYHIYYEKTNELTEQITAFSEPNDPKCENLRKLVNKITDIMMMLKQTQSKQNIMREACEIFYDPEFLDKLDKNPYLMCFNNCIVDFNLKIYRKGQPDDFISKCTNIDYIPFNQAKHGNVLSEIKLFMSQLFPVKELEEYMWEHLASCLIGVNTNQTFHIYKGNGRNGKSALTALMSKCMGSYKGVVPITLITTKRNAIGGTSSEVALLDGVRYAVMQEPTKGDKINEGSMKELTGGTDPIQARALFKDTVTFVPQFKLVVCTNNDFEDTSNDDGTWRRMKYIDFMSVFLEVPYSDEVLFPRSECPYQFPLVLELEKKKFPEWVPVFMAILVQKAFENQGIVKECKMVMANSNKHRESQDYLTGFVKDNIKKMEKSVVKKTALMEVFKNWYIESHSGGNKTIPKGKDVTEFMNKRFGVYKNGWHNIAIIYDEDDPINDC